MKIKNYIRNGLTALALAGALLTVKPEPSNQPEKYAVLINESDEQEFSVMARRTRENLLKMGFEKNNIYLLNSSGNLENIASKKNVKKMFSSLEKRIDENDLLVVYFLGHGNRITIFQDGRPKELSVVVLKNEYIDENEIYNSLSKIHPKIGIVTTDTCYGRGIAKKIGRGNFIGISSSDENPALFFENQSFMTEFYDAFKKEEADANSNGKISIKEAFDYVQTYIGAMSREITPILISEMDADSVTLE